MKPKFGKHEPISRNFNTSKKLKISSLKLQRASGILFTTSPFLVSECAILYMRKRIGKRKEKGIVVGII